jgi:DNA polymerase-3 subunit delta'
VPAGDAVLILVSHDTGRLPVTIRSRCQNISVSQPDKAVVLDWLATGNSRSPGELSAALQAAGGSPLRAARYLDSPELDAYAKVREALAMLLGRPASVSLVGSQLEGLDPIDLWRWLSMCTSEVVKSRMARQPLHWLQTNVALCDRTLLQLQKQADVNRQLSVTPVRGDLLLQDWLIRWAEQAF